MKIGYFDTKELCQQGRPALAVRGSAGQIRAALFIEPDPDGLGAADHWSTALIARQSTTGAVGGVENSYHVQGLAADIRPENLEDLPELQDLCLELNSDGGVGLYDSFVHVDARGFKARWDNCKK